MSLDNPMTRRICDTCNLVVYTTEDRGVNGFQCGQCVNQHASRGIFQRVRSDYRYG
jgi:hypothetical protein